LRALHKKAIHRADPLGRYSSDQVAVRICAIGAIGQRTKADERGEGVGIVLGSLGDLEKRAAAIRAPLSVVPMRLPLDDQAARKCAIGTIGSAQKLTSVVGCCRNRWRSWRSGTWYPHRSRQNAPGTRFAPP